MSNEQEHTEQLPDEPQAEAARPLPPLVCQGEGYITRADGTVIPFTIHGEA